MRPKGTGRTKRRKKSVQKEKEREKRREKDERRMKTGQKRMKGRMHLCKRHRKIATHLPQNYTFVFNSKDVWRKRAILTAFT